MLAMHFFQPFLVVQIVNLKFDPVRHISNVDISDGIHYIPAIVDVDLQCYVDFAFEDVNVCDFIVVKESVGHPATFDFRLVSIQTRLINIDTSKCIVQIGLTIRIHIFPYKYM